MSRGVERLCTWKGKYSENSQKTETVDIAQSVLVDVNMSKRN